MALTLDDAVKLYYKAIKGPGILNEIIEIDPITRQIMIPTTEALFGVWTDKDVERKYFRVPRYVGDDIDLKEFQIYISYSLNNVVNDMYAVTDVKADGDYLIFTWLVGANACSTVGKITFAIHASKTDGTGKVIKKWNTTTVTVPTVITTYDTMDDLSSSVEYQDLLTQLLEDIKTTVTENGKLIESEELDADLTEVYSDGIN